MKANKFTVLFYITTWFLCFDVLSVNAGSYVVQWANDSGGTGGPVTLTQESTTPKGVVSGNIYSGRFNGRLVRLMNTDGTLGNEPAGWMVLIDDSNEGNSQTDYYYLSTFTPNNTYSSTGINFPKWSTLVSSDPTRGNGGPTKNTSVYVNYH